MGDPVKRFVVRREKWMRGLNKYDTRLLDDDGKMCCLGFVCVQCGMAPETIHDLGTPEDVASYDCGSPEPVTGVLGFYDDERGRWCDNALTRDAISINDDGDIDDAERERRLSELFAKHGYEMVFE